LFEGWGLNGYGQPHHAIAAAWSLSLFGLNEETYIMAFPAI
jgi:hypothetical protein